MFVFVTVLFNAGSIFVARATNIEVSPDVEPNVPVHISDVDATCEYESDEFDKACAKEHLRKLEDELEVREQQLDAEKQLKRQEEEQKQQDANATTPQTPAETTSSPKDQMRESPQQSQDGSRILKLDQAVKSVQVYLNATYGSIPSFDKIPETGITGWTTVYGLIEGLQYELGLDNLVQSFGPTTQSLYKQKVGNLNESFAGINGATGNARGSAKRIFALVQGALIAKGYNPGSYNIGAASPTGIFSAVTQMTSDAGFRNINYVNLKVAKGLFSMDQYKVIDGGKPNIREIQQDLNRRYAFQHEPFDIIPTDGFYSRGVSTGLIYALQFELGFSDSEATGFIGNGTKARLKEQANFNVGAEDTNKYFVHLFKAALIFNGYSCAYTYSFTAADSEVVKKCKRFINYRQLEL
jgi:peptidoglycan hydrolase-like protein with peptidoglycan-binding domain